MMFVRQNVFCRLTVVTCLTLFLCSCTYLKYASVQADYARIQEARPGQLNVKHMIDRETYFVHGRCIDTERVYAGVPKALAAYSNKYRNNERVDTTYFEVSGSHFGMNLPEGEYDLLVFADLNGNSVFEQSEVVGRRPVNLDSSTAEEKVLGQVDVRLAKPISVDWEISIDSPDFSGRTESLFYPAGAIRTLDDPLFDSGFSTLGMYDPASFFEQAPTGFYALEEELGYKIAVVFVHGIAGSARDFAPLVEQLDRSRYKPWFFYYPSGGDLDQLAELFYQIYLSGKVSNTGGMPMIIVAHSMGGLVVREALNKYEGTAGENEVHLFVSLASPFGGHAAAAAGEEHGLIVLPSWRDLNPASPFIQDLYRKPLPDFVHHELIYAYQNSATIKLGENSDGVVALASQLHPPAQSQASGQFGFDNTHTDILESESVVEHILSRMEAVKNIIPPTHLQLAQQGGFDVPLSDAYSPVAQYVIRATGIYAMALTNGTITPLDKYQERLIDVVNGEKVARTEVEKGWLLFLDEYPELRGE